MNVEPSPRKLILAGLFTRLFLDTGVQVFFPFLRTIAGGIGITTVELGRLISLKSLTGLLAPLFGVLAERKGNRHVMRLALFVSAVGYYYIAISADLVLLTVGMLLTGIGGFAYLPTLQSYLSAYLPYGKRARGLGIVEYAWALSGIFGLFLVGLLIEATSWRAPFFIFGGAFVVAFFSYQFLPSARGEAKRRSRTSRLVLHNLGALVGLGGAILLGQLLVTATWRVPIIALGSLGALLWFSRARPSRLATPGQDGRPHPAMQLFQIGQNASSTWAAIAVNALVMYAASNLFITYGDWLEGGYGLSPTQLGTVALVMGAFDLCASVLVSLIVDRAGKRRSVLWGGCVATLAFVALPWSAAGLVGAVTGLVLARVSFEFTVVSHIPLLSEQAPQQRSKVLGLATASALLGASLAGFSGPWLLGGYGIAGVSWLSAGAMAAAVGLVLWRVREPDAFAQA